MWRLTRASDMWLQGYGAYLTKLHRRYWFKILCIAFFSVSLAEFSLSVDDTSFTCTVTQFGRYSHGHVVLLHVS
jgi:hypothetical protein